VMAATNCDDNNPCTVDTCNTETGCVHTVRTGSCEDGDYCTTGDTCVGDKCTAGTPVTCAEDQCNTAWCDTSFGCRYVPKTTGTVCNDGSLCTSADKCDAGRCVGTQNVSCVDTNPCTTDYCDPIQGCMNVPNTDQCNDNNTCTENDVCSGGTCAGKAVECPSDGDQCTNDVCVAGQGCDHVPHLGACNDGVACTMNDTCGVNGACAGVPETCVSPNTCLVGNCLEGFGCQYTIKADNAPCTDGTVCTSGDACQAGVCRPGTTVNCNDNKECTNDLCDAVRGCVHTLKDRCGCARNSDCDLGDGSAVCCDWRWGDWERKCYLGACN
jgi:hypothetical protein